MAENKQQKTLEQEIQDVLASSSDTIKTALRDQLKTQVVEHLTLSLRDQVAEQVREFMQTDEMKAEIESVLVELRPTLLAQLRSNLVTVAASVVNAVAVKAQENLTSSYKMRKVLDALFD